MTETKDQSAILTVADLQAWYGESKALHGMNFHVTKGELVTLIGRNGAGKTTALRSIMGLVQKKAGTIRFGNEDLSRRPAEFIARRGIAYCPEERGIFASLTVGENLELPPIIAPGGMSVEEIFTLFPNLKQRWSSQGTKLSGGEQQMLAIARILRTGAKFLLLDEPTEGLAPVIVKQIATVVEGLKSRGYTLLMVEQNFRFAAKLADRHCIVEHGRVVDTFRRDEVAAATGKIQAYLGV